MPLELIAPTDVIPIQFVPILIFGPPGSGKTSIAQTAYKPVTLDFDKGIHRCENRRECARFDTWAKYIQAGNEGLYEPFKTLVIDTGGRALDLMIPDVIKENPKNSYAGNLSPQGWGVLGGRFTTWMKLIQTWGKDVVMICHQENAKDDAGNADMFPDLPGKMSLKEVHKQFDCIGRIRYEGQQRFLDFSPREGSTMCKNAAHWNATPVPDLHENKTFLADLIADAKSRIGKTAEASAAVAATTDTWESWLEKVGDNIDSLNGGLPDLAELKGAAKRQAWTLIERHAKDRGWEFIKAEKCFVATAEQAA